jgi:hypothetical protein
VSALLISTTVFLTVILALSFGIACGYWAVLGVLNWMAHDRVRSAERAAAASLTHAAQGGD